MGQQLSKTSPQNHSTETSTTSSSVSSSQSYQIQPITCSPQKMKLISKQIKIKTTSFLKTTLQNTPQTTHNQPNSQTQPLSQLLHKIHSNFKAHQSKQKNSQSQQLIPAQLHQPDPMNLDIDRIDSLFEFVEQNLNLNQFETYFSTDNNILILNWKTSVNTIMTRLITNFPYSQGQLLICAIIRLYLDQDTTYWFMSQLLQKVGHLLNCPDKLQNFRLELDKHCEPMFPKLKKQLDLNDLDFQVVYLNWVLGIFATSFSKETCMRIWYKLVFSQNPIQILQFLIISCMDCIEEHFKDQPQKLNNPEVCEIQLTNQYLSTVINQTLIHDLIK